MNKQEIRKTIIGVSLALLIIFPILFWIKSKGEPSDWWINSVWMPSLMLPMLEILCGFSAWWNTKRLYDENKL